MVFVIVKIVANLSVLNDWFARHYTDTNNLLDLYNDLACGKVDKGGTLGAYLKIKNKISPPVPIFQKKG